LKTVGGAPATAGGDARGHFHELELKFDSPTSDSES